MQKLFKTYGLIISLVVAFLVSGCSSSALGPNSVMNYDTKNTLTPDETSATITFFREKQFLRRSWFAAPVALYDENEDKMIFVGNLDKGTRATIKVKEGHYEFAILGDMDFCVLADVEAGKNYYVELLSAPSLLKESYAGRVIKPKDLESDYYKDLISDNKNCVVNANGAKWFEGKHDEFLRRYKEARQNFDPTGFYDKNAILKAQYGIENILH